uniref:Uncharacterized protein n=1 Tax=Rhodococcus sp. NS1 TaxID=402236 RepID=A0A097SQI7_9NOCA|nr:hypothetical protein LRS1606.355 [Rhodococcus sp. NS1]
MTRPQEPYRHSAGTPISPRAVQTSKTPRPRLISSQAPRETHLPSTSTHAQPCHRPRHYQPVNTAPTPDLDRLPPMSNRPHLARTHRRRRERVAIRDHRSAIRGPHSRRPGPLPEAIGRSAHRQIVHHRLIDEPCGTVTPLPTHHLR